MLKLAVNRHKARLSAELTKTRIKSGYSTLDAFRHVINEAALMESSTKGVPHPRWVRVNTLKTSMEEQLASTFAKYMKVDHLKDVITARPSAPLLHVDEHIPNLIALPPKADFTSVQIKKAYTSGELIIQDKASCFPAYLLDPQPGDKDVIDACAAPGNKTSHLAALINQQKGRPRIHAFEKDGPRTGILRKMLKIAGATAALESGKGDARSRVTIHGGRDFLSTITSSDEFSKVGALLLDPSCSGSGIVGRDDTLKMHLPDASAGGDVASASHTKGKKRKRGGGASAASAQSPPPSSISLHYSQTEEEQQEQEEGSPADAHTALETRLTALSTFQLRILLHAMWFSKARKITYSTCSIHFQENEGVVFRALESDVAKKRGWRVLRREDQVEGLKKWNKRGVWEEHDDIGADLGEGERKEILEACLRCEAGTEEGTMGFFVAGFVRDGTMDVEEWEHVQNTNEAEVPATTGNDIDKDNGDDGEWNGFTEEEDGVEETAAGPQPTSNGTASKEKKASKHLKKRKKLL